MNDSSAAAERSYDDFYARFDSPLANAIRHEVYGRDIGQHSWVLAEELEGVSQLLRLSRASRLLASSSSRNVSCSWWSCPARSRRGAMTAGVSG